MTQYYGTTYSQKHIPVIPGDIGLPTDAYIYTGPIPDHATVQAYVPTTDTLAGGLSWTGVMDAIEKGPQSHAEASAADRGMPVWALACVFGGLVLMALAMVMLTVVIPLHRTFGRG
jgi:hypothetical protein